MLIFIGFLFLLPMVLFFARQYKTSTPSLQWPALAPILKFEFHKNPPMLTGAWEGRPVVVELRDESVFVTMRLAQPSRLRVEVGPKDEVARRAGIIVPDPVATQDHAFDSRLLARCSDKEAGQAIFDPTLRQRLLAQPIVDALGEGNTIRWRLPELKEPDPLEHVLEVMTAIAAEMERFQANA